MLLQEIETLVASMSQQDKRILRELLRSSDEELQDEWAAFQSLNSLVGSVSRYDEPFEPAMPASDWEVLRDSA